jgi:hypothetical protein
MDALVVATKLLTSEEPLPGHSHEYNIVRDQLGERFHIMRIPGLSPLTDKVCHRPRGLALDCIGRSSVIAHVDRLAGVP